MRGTDNDRRQVEREVQKTLQSLDNLEDIETGPYFYTRIAKRLREISEVGTGWSSRFVVRSGLTASILSIVILLNVITAVVVIRDRQGTQKELRRNAVEAVADEYLLAGSPDPQQFEAE